MITSGLSMIGPWPGSIRRGASFREEAQRVQVLPQVAAVAGGNHDCPADAPMSPQNTSPPDSSKKQR